MLMSAFSIMRVADGARAAPAAFSGRPLQLLVLLAHIASAPQRIVPSADKVCSAARALKCVTKWLGI
jgi:hypothetical protein